MPPPPNAHHAAVPQLFMRRPSLEHLPPLPALTGHDALREASGDDAAALAEVLSSAFEQEWTVERVTAALLDEPDVAATFVVTSVRRPVATASARLVPELYPDSGYLHWVGSSRRCPRAAPGTAGFPGGAPSIPRPRVPRCSPGDGSPSPPRDPRLSQSRLCPRTTGAGARDGLARDPDRPPHGRCGDSGSRERPPGRMTGWGCWPPTAACVLWVSTAPSRFDARAHAMRPYRRAWRRIASNDPAWPAGLPIRPAYVRRAGPRGHLRRGRVLVGVGLAMMTRVVLPALPSGTGSPPHPWLSLRRF